VTGSRRIVMTGADGIVMTGADGFLNKEPTDCDDRRDGIVMTARTASITADSVRMLGADGIV